MPGNPAGILSEIATGLLVVAIAGAHPARTAQSTTLSL